MSAAAGQSPLDQLPGDLMMWVLSVSDLLAFGAGLAILGLVGVRCEPRSV